MSDVVVRWRCTLKKLTTDCLTRIERITILKLPGNLSFRFVIR